MTTLTELQSACRDHALHPAAYAKVCKTGARQPTADETAACDLIVRHGIEHLHLELKGKKSRDVLAGGEEAFMATVRQKIEAAEMQPAQGGQPCKVGLLLGALFSWLIGQALTWLWNWFKRARNASRQVKQMLRGTGSVGAAG